MPDSRQSEVEPHRFDEAGGYHEDALMHCKFCHRCRACGRILRKFWPGRRFGHTADCPKRGVRINVA